MVWFVRLTAGHANAISATLVGKDMTIKEEREYRLLEEKFIYKPEQRRWDARYSWIKDLRSLQTTNHMFFTL